MPRAKPILHTFQNDTALPTAKGGEKSGQMRRAIPDWRGTRGTGPASVHRGQLRSGTCQCCCFGPSLPSSLSAASAITWFAPCTKLICQEGSKRERPEPEKLAGSFHRFSGCSSPINQPVAFSVFIGSGRSQSKHWNVRCPSPPGGSARIKNAPQCGRTFGLAHTTFCRRFPNLVNSKKGRSPKSTGNSVVRRGRVGEAAYCFCSG